MIITFMSVTVVTCTQPQGSNFMRLKNIDDSFWYDISVGKSKDRFRKKGRIWKAVQVFVEEYI